MLKKLIIFLVIYSVSGDSGSDSSRSGSGRKLRCKRHEIINPCGKTIQPQCVTTPCNPICSPTCECKIGYTRDPISENCVKPKCKQNELWGCTDNCGQTCEYYSAPCPLGPGPEVCTYGCICKPGYARRQSDKACVLGQTFCKPCNINTSYNDCGNSCLNKTCATLLQPCDPIPGCVQGCYCNNGYVSDGNGGCVLETTCSAGAESNAGGRGGGGAGAIAIATANGK